MTFREKLPLTTLREPRSKIGKKTMGIKQFEKTFADPGSGTEFP